MDRSNRIDPPPGILYGRGMKTRESGMPPEEQWHAYFDPAAVLKALGLTADCRCVVDCGCGYGTFTLPAARIVRGEVHALDIDSEMIRVTRESAAREGLRNVRVSQRDFVENGFGLATGEAEFVMLFNILHAEEAPLMLREARRVLSANGQLAVIHWNYDPATPRGPSMAIRLTPERCREIVREAGFTVGSLVDLPPYHYGFASTV